jgi:hypothetical protein
VITPRILTPESGRSLGNEFAGVAYAVIARENRYCTVLTFGYSLWKALELPLLVEPEKGGWQNQPLEPWRRSCRHEVARWEQPAPG